MEEEQSLNSEIGVEVRGISQPCTMKLKGQLKGTILIMIDSRASHNFISEELVYDLGLKVDKTELVCLGMVIVLHHNESVED